MPEIACISLKELVGARGFEPPTPGPEPGLGDFLNFREKEREESFLFSPQVAQFWCRKTPGLGNSVRSKRVDQLTVRTTR